MRDSAPSHVAARKTMRGLMVDAGRVPESMDYYRRVVEFCAEWELNTLQFRIF
jgi:N-acetyl-beta-hexosaminidase